MLKSFISQMKRSVRGTANRKPDEEQMKKIGGFLLFCIYLISVLKTE